MSTRRRAPLEQPRKRDPCRLCGVVGRLTKTHVPAHPTPNMRQPIDQIPTHRRRLGRICWRESGSRTSHTAQPIARTGHKIHSNRTVSPWSYCHRNGAQHDSIRSDGTSVLRFRGERRGAAISRRKRATCRSRSVESRIRALARWRRPSSPFPPTFLTSREGLVTIAGGTQRLRSRSSHRVARA